MAAPRLLAVALVLGTVAVLVWQSRELTQLLRQAPATTAPAAMAPASGSAAAANTLFGAAAGNAGAALPLRLLASFVAARDADSSALFALPDGRSRQVRVGGEIHPGVVLSGVWPDHVTLSAPGRTARLGFAPAAANQP